MSILSTVTAILDTLKLPVETGVFTESPPEVYTVLTPLNDSFDLFADNTALQEIQELRISLFCKGNYTSVKNSIVRAMLAADIYITDRRYVGHENDTGYHHYAIDVANSYTTEEYYGNNRS